MAIASAVAAGLEWAWLPDTASGVVPVLVVLVGTNAAIAAVLVALGPAAAWLVGESVALGPHVQALREASWGHRFGSVLGALGVAALGAAALGLGLGLVHRLAEDRIATPHLRAPAAAIAGVALAAMALLVVPALVLHATRRLRRASARAAGLVAAGIALALSSSLVAAVVALWGVLTELDRRPLLALLIPLAGVLLGRAAGRSLARRSPSWAAALLALLLLGCVGSAIVLVRARRALESTIAMALQSAPLVGWMGRRRTAPPPGPRARLFPPEPGAARGPPARHLVLVTIDALRHDHATPARMPRLAALARTGSRFDAAFCTVPGSLRSLPSILTGRYSNALPWKRPGQVYLDPARTETLPEILLAQGFWTLYVPHNRFVLNPGTQQGFARVVDPILLPEADRARKLPRAMPMVEATLQVLTDRPPVDRRLFLWSHFMDPHAPYHPHPWSRGTRDVDRYEAEVVYSDRALRRLLDGLDALGVLRDAVVVVTADHGEEFGEHGATRHSRTVFLPAIRVPLVIAVPGGAGRVLRRPVSHVDLLPTLLELLGLSIPRRLDGRSLAGAIRHGAALPERTILSVSYPRYDPVPGEYAAIRGRFDLHTDAAGVPTALYDWQRDSLERRNLLDEVPETLVTRLAGDVARYRSRGLGAPAR